MEDGRLTLRQPWRMRWWCVGSSRPVCAKSSWPGWIASRRTPLRCWWQGLSSTRESPLNTCAGWPISKNRTDSLPWTERCTATCCRSHSARDGAHLMAERSRGLSLLTMLPAPEIEHLYTYLGRAYELNAEWEKAQAVYMLMLAHAQDVCQPAMESTALNRLATLAAQ